MDTRGIWSGSIKTWSPLKSPKARDVVPDAAGTMTDTITNTVAVLIPVDDTTWRSLPLNLADLQRQRDVQPHIVVLDRTESGLGAVEGVTVVAVGAEASLGDAIHSGLRQTSAALIAISLPGVRSLPTRLSRQRADLSLNRHIDMVTSNIVLVDDDGCLVAEASPDKAEEAPTPFWQAGAMFRRAALARIGQSSDLPVELFLYMRLRAQGRIGHSEVVYSVATKASFDEAIEGSLQDALAVRKISPPIAPRNDRIARERARFDARLTRQPSVTDALDRMIREGTFDR